jgi:endogenous inhibitor of DNA gyrase (YacG/DUF329 family)
MRKKPITRDEVRFSGQHITTLPIDSVRKDGPIKRLWTPLLCSLNLTDAPWPFGRARECEHCGKKFFRVLSARHRYHSYCSDRCIRLARSAAQSERISDARADARADFKCSHCGEPLDARRSTMRFCSTKCRVAAHRRRSEPIRRALVR